MKARSTSRPSRHFRPLLGSIAALLALGALRPAAQAGQVWDGGGASGLWSNALNWNADTLPNFATPLEFGGLLQLAANNDATGSVAGLTFNPGAGPFTLSGQAVTLTGGITNSSANLQTVSFAGITLGTGQTFTAGTAALSVTSPIALGANTLTIDGAQNATLSGALTGPFGGLLKSGAGTLVLSGANSYTGQTSVMVGTVKAGSATAFAPTSAFFVSGTLDLGGFSNSVGSLGGLATGFVQNIGATAATLTTGGNNLFSTYAGVIRDGAGGSALSITKVGTGRQTFTGTNTYSGDTLLQGGTLFSDVAPAAATNSAFGTGRLVISGGTTLGSTLNGEFIPNNIRVLGDFTLAAGQPATNNLILTGEIDLNSGVREIFGSTPNGQLNLRGSISNGGVTLTHTGGGGYSSFIYGNNDLADVANAYTGLTTLNANVFLVLNKSASAGLDAAVKGDVLVNAGGSVDYFQADQIADTATVTVHGSGLSASGTQFAALELRGHSDTIGGLFGDGVVGLGSATLTVGAGNFSGVIGDGVVPLAGTGGQLTKNTAGTLLLSGANSYTGNTNVNGGTLFVPGRLASPVVKVNAGDFIAGKSNTLRPTATVNVAAGAGFEYHAATDAQLTIRTLTFGGGAGTVIGGSIGSTATSARIFVTTPVMPTPGAVRVNVFAVNGAANSAIPSYTLLTAAAGSTLSTGVMYTLGTVFNATNFTVGTPVATPTTLSVPIFAATPLTQAYWIGGLSGMPNVWSASDGTRSNWASDNTGTLTPLVPGAGTAVFFSAGPPATPTDPGNTTLGANMSIASLTINAPGAPETRAVTLNDEGYTLTLAGAGGITVNSGAGPLTLKPGLILGASQTWTNNSANLLTIGGNVSNDGNQLTIAGSGNALLSGVIGNGAGGLTKTGAGRLTVTQNNTYTGDTNLTGGALFADVIPASSANTSFGTGALNISDGTRVGSTVDNQSIRNAVNALGDFTIEAHTHLALSGSLDLNGGTRTITGSTVNAEIRLIGEIKNGGVTFNSPVDHTSFIIGNADGGDVANTYTGLTTVNNNVYLVLNKVLAFGGIDGAIAGNVVQNGTGSLDYFQDDQIANTARVTVNGPGDLLGGELFAGLQLNGHSETIGSLFGTSAGLVQLGAGVLTVGAGSFPGIIADGAVLGTGVGGQIIKNTAGTLTLSGANTYTGDTNINNGTLVLNGSVQSPLVAVNFSGTLMGTGLAAHNVLNAGVISPGNSAGTFHIGGNFRQTGAGTTVIKIGGKNAGEHDLITVGGQAQLDGTLRLVKLGKARLKVGDKVTFLTAAAGVSGQYRTVNNGLETGTISSAAVVYGTNDVAVEIQQGSFAGLGSLTRLTPNQKIVAGQLDRVVSQRGERKLIDFLNGEPLAGLPRAFDLIAPEELQSIYSIGHTQANVQTANLQRRLDDVRAGVHGFSAEGLSVSGTGEQAHAEAVVAAPLAGANGPAGEGGRELRAPEDRRFGTFITGVGEFARVSGTVNARGYELATGGFTLGADYRVNEHFTAGLNTGYARSGADLAGGGRVTVDGAKLGAYATWFDEGLYVDAAVQGGYNSYGTRRAALRGTASGSTTGGEVNALVATGFDFTSDALRIGPTASFQYTHIGFSGFRESGSLAPLTLPSQGSDSTRSAIGMKAAYEFRLASGVVVRPEARLAWQHEFGDIAYALASRLGGGSVFNVQGAEIGRDSALLGLGVAVLWSERTAAYLYYDGEVGRSNYSSNNVSGGVRMTF